MMNLGVRAHDFGKHPVNVLAEKIHEKGFTCIQLALAKALSDIDSVAGSLSPGLANYIGEAFEKKNIRIAVLGCYINPIHPDIDTRRNQLERFKEHLRFARDFGCSVVATETGSLNPDCSFHPQNNTRKAFGELVRSVSELVDEADKFGVFACIEGVTRHTISSPELMAEALESIGSNNLQVLFDPVNLISIDNYTAHQEMIRKSFELFGDSILVVHAKDFNVHDGSIVMTCAGDGLLDYKYLLSLVKQRKPYIDILIEDLAVEQMDDAKRFIRDTYDSI